MKTEGTNGPKNDIREMARCCYGYGLWDAPYWFIGPEQGQAREENNDLSNRLQAWSCFGKRELDDCREFHLLIGERRWHCEPVKLQPTWRRLILLLMGFLGKQTDNETLREYQSREWGRLNGETCVIELSGLAAHSFQVVRDRKSFRQTRIDLIRNRIREHGPRFVIMYGKKQALSWEQIADYDIKPDNIRHAGTTAFAVMPSPTAYGSTDAAWVEIGKRLRR